MATANGFKFAGRLKVILLSWHYFIEHGNIEICLDNEYNHKNVMPALNKHQEKYCLKDLCSMQCIRNKEKASGLSLKSYDGIGRAKSRRYWEHFQ